MKSGFVFLLLKSIFSFNCNQIRSSKVRQKIKLNLPFSFHIRIQILHYTNYTILTLGYLQLIVLRQVEPRPDNQSVSLLRMYFSYFFHFNHLIDLFLFLSLCSVSFYLFPFLSFKHFFKKIVLTKGNQPSAY